jgi:5-formyltetrahydrofolate cyclo-ligase
LTDEIHLRKKELRKLIRQLKAHLSPAERDKRSVLLMHRIEKNEMFLKAQTIFIYWAMDDEIDTRHLIKKWSGVKKFILPAINGDELHLKEFNGAESLVAGDLYSIPEPDGQPFSDFDSIELVLVPGIAFDGHNNRMGRGKAYYDKILHKFKGRTHLLGVCYDFQMVEEVPVEPHDIKMDGVIYA